MSREEDAQVSVLIFGEPHEQVYQLNLFGEEVVASWVPNYSTSYQAAAQMRRKLIEKNLDDWFADELVNSVLQLDGEEGPPLWFAVINATPHQQVQAALRAVEPIIKKKPSVTEAIEKTLTDGEEVRHELAKN